MARTDPMIHVRLPSELKEALENAAKLAGRSVNAEVVHRLSNGLAPEKDGRQKIVPALADAVMEVDDAEYQLSLAKEALDEAKYERDHVGNIELVLMQSEVNKLDREVIKIWRKIIRLRRQSDEGDLDFFRENPHWITLEDLDGRIENAAEMLRLRTQSKKTP